MGLTYDSMKKESLKDMFNVQKDDDEHVIALAGNPNTGKSTVFNNLTGLRQHTGNWPGKTVVNARGRFSHENENYVLVDLPGTYSLFASSEEEVVARDFVCFGNPDAVVVVTDATCLERNLNLVFQVMELTKKVILCVNLYDEARNRKMDIDAEGLEKELGIPVVLTAARSGYGLKDLKAVINKVVRNEYEYNNKLIKYKDDLEKYIELIEPKINKLGVDINSRWLSLRLIDGDNKIFDSMNNYIDEEDYDKIVDFANNVDINMSKSNIREHITETNYKYAEDLCEKYVTDNEKKYNRDRKIDNILTSKVFGVPIMLALLGAVFWITITGANYPSQILANLLFGFEEKITSVFNYFNAPDWLHGVTVLGLYRTLAWVVSVMLPPMAIFFPLFTLLEDLGYLPRVAYNLDHLFKKACAHGKQCLSMCMGFGCNAAGVIGCRIINSPREKLIAILTNNFVPCNGRFPTLITIATVFFATFSYRAYNSIVPALTITGLVVIGIIVTLLVSYFLSKTILKGVPSSFTLELPPYRKPQIGRVIYTSIIDRTVFVLTRAVIVAIPAGIVTWIFANIMIGDMSILEHCAYVLDPFSKLLGLDGYILMAFILGFPANEIVLPILLMAYLSTGEMIEFESIASLRDLLISRGWTYLTALNVMLFSLLHWPCSTTLWTIKKETGSWKWTFLGFLIPTVVAIVVCFFTATVFRLFGWA